MMVVDEDQVQSLTLRRGREEAQQRPVAVVFEILPPPHAP